jgi:lipopolysaccharide heptosyltransferase I
MKVLIIKLSSIGDVVHTLPALVALRKGFEKSGVAARIDWLVEEAASEVLTGHPLLDDVIVVKRRGWLTNLMANLGLALRLRRARYDTVIDFQGLLKSGVWAFLSGGTRRLGFSNARELSGVFLNEKVTPSDPEGHAVDRYIELAGAAGGMVDRAASRLNNPIVESASRQASRDQTRDAGMNCPDSARRGAARKLDAAGVLAKPGFFAMVPRARWPTKLWDDERFIGLAREVEAGWGLGAVLVGGAGDRDSLEDMRAAIGGRAVNLAGRLDLKEIAWVFSLSRFAVTVDSGPMHIAAAAGARVVALFGPTAPWRTGPYGGGHAVVRLGLACSPCFRRDCPDPRCMKDITRADVLAAIETLIGGPARKMGGPAPASVPLTGARKGGA